MSIFQSPAVKSMPAKATAGNNRTEPIAKANWVRVFILPPFEWFFGFSGRTHPLLRFLASGRVAAVPGRNGGGWRILRCVPIRSVEIDFPEAPRLSLRSNHDEPIERGQQSNRHTNENLRIMRCNKVYKHRNIQIA